MNEFLVVLNDINKSLIKELLTLPQNVKGFGHIKEANIETFLRRRNELGMKIRNNSITKTAAE